MIAKRAPYDMVLIVCEGEKTEPNYFKALIKHLKLNTANVTVADDTSGSSPINVVGTAIDLFDAAKKAKNPFDKVYCVMDRDQAPSYQKAINKLEGQQTKKVPVPIKAITSVPCFEFWILLHYRYTTKDYYAGPGKVCNKVIADLRKYIPNYEKGDKGTFEDEYLKDKLEYAKDQAKKVSEDRKKLGIDEKLGTYNPYTEVHELVSHLQELSHKKASSG
ncbi:MAG: RloB domain-containing protein [Deltaproteobacteria bacterium]|nr:RloB domain-containing protein [Deltaproteobacteria bacterium]